MQIDNVYIIMPAYNEEANIKEVVENWIEVVDTIGNGSKLVVLNDGSKDNTLNILNSLHLDNLIVLDKKNSGHGPTLLLGYYYACSKNPTYIFQTDSDGQTLTCDFWKFWEQKKYYDVIIGYRKYRKDGFSRIIVTKTLKAVLKIVFSENITDANTPFRLMNTFVLKKALKKVPENFFLANVLLSVIFVKDKTIQTHFELIEFKARQGGKNSINLPRIFKIGIKSLKEFFEVKKNL